MSARRRPRSQQPLICAVYLLLDPTTKEVRYVGATTDLIGRMRTWQGIVKSRGMGTASKRLKKWLNDLDGRHPIVEIACYCHSANEVFQKELEWIDKGIALGWNLCNVIGA